MNSGETAFEGEGVMKLLLDSPCVMVLLKLRNETLLKLAGINYGKAQTHCKS